MRFDKDSTTPSDSFVSVVTPFYNTAPYLAECIESVLAQTHTNFEYVLDDNGSTDCSLDIAKRYAEMDARIRVVQTDRFLPQIENYNFAISNISDQSRYCKVVQADDWLYPQCLAEMVRLADRHPNVGLVSSYRLDGRDLDGGGLEAEQCTLDGIEVGRMHLESRMFLFGTPTTVLYRADLVRKRPMFYDIEIFQSDTDTAYDLLTESDFGFVHQVLSFSRADSGSIARRRLRFRPRELDFLVAVTRHGPRFLSADEQSALQKRTISMYYTSLAKGWVQNLIRGETDAYLEHHRTALAVIGMEIRRTDLAKGFLRAIVKTLAPLAPPRNLARLRSTGT